MAVAWFLCPYRHDPNPGNPRRWCAMNEFTAQIRADGGDWTESEVLGNQAIVKVRATAGTLTTIAAAPGFRRIPLARLDDPLSSLSAAQRTAIRNELLNAGYTTEEITAALPDLATVTLRQVLRFLASRRREPRYDTGTNTIILDGPIVAGLDPDVLERKVTD